MKKVLIMGLCICAFLVGCSKTNELKEKDISVAKEINQQAESKSDSSITNEDSSGIINDKDESPDEETKMNHPEENNNEKGEDGTDSKEDETKEIISVGNSVNEEYYKEMDNMTEDEFITKVQGRNIYQENCSFYNEIISYRERVLLTTDISVVIHPLFETDKQYYNKEDFKDCSKNVLLVARNEIYARYGRIFENEDLNNYFRAQLWYEPRFTAEEFDTSILNDYEIKNIQTIHEAEKDMGYR
ncbi:YARHG domain-containing protein [Anaerocolumna aminovalerica]|uniref:YARHG domain-containing protein n=1 Tax=Anaerocolumna aminovalerica TaxID=1527 RepID=UPI00248C7580|nr:YARHG domain-containing protein [Anaerocolumna aminovalerica]